ncbi:SDR family oxidoreductase [Pedobacter cryoconitis]|uniref:Putative oxidoreductase n=1 Tax=Pedobacter cryoconitis TaxID=188932 RepID=A0A7X0MJP2_9SPHI|nr:SDR family NAD(P)-dependent oxidoreductase [Pedobacter cryoconitis]MBB6501211.1 putative oxidoreductase [Pedobacter cryoconitis]
MKTTNRTVLITGGGSGIGFEIAKLLLEAGNEVIITGRTESRLKEAAEKLKGVHLFTSDITNENDVNELVNYLSKNHPKLDLLINNAGKAYAYELSATADIFEKAKAETQTNYLSVINLTEKLLPLLNEQPEAAIVNVTSIVAFAASSKMSTYAASKAALHSFTQSLRYTLAKNTGIKVFELMPPLVDTEFSKEIGGHNGIPPGQVAEELIAGLNDDNYEIHVGGTADFYKLSLSSPQEAFKLFNQD